MVQEVGAGGGGAEERRAEQAGEKETGIVAANRPASTLQLAKVQEQRYRCDIEQFVTATARPIVAPIRILIIATARGLRMVVERKSGVLARGGTVWV